VFIVFRFTGLRVSQAMGLRWEDFDFERRTLTFRGELRKTTQEHQGRIIHVSQHLLDTIGA
jgi:integrase